MRWIAGTQLTPRVIAATFLRDRPVRFAIGLVVLTFLPSIWCAGDAAPDPQGLGHVE